MDKESVSQFKALKKQIACASFSAINKTLPFVVECDDSETAVLTTLN